MWNQVAHGFKSSQFYTSVFVPAARAPLAGASLCPWCHRVPLRYSVQTSCPETLYCKKGFENIGISGWIHVAVEVQRGAKVCSPVPVSKNQEEHTEDDAGCADVDADDHAAQRHLLVTALTRPLFPWHQRHAVQSTICGSVMCLRWGVLNWRPTIIPVAHGTLSQWHQPFGTVTLSISIKGYQFHLIYSSSFWTRTHMQEYGAMVTGDVTRINEPCEMTDPHVQIIIRSNVNFRGPVWRDDWQALHIGCCGNTKAPLVALHVKGHHG